MSLAILNSGVLLGVEMIPVRVEVHVGSGLPSFTVVGMPDTGVRESRERVRAAIINSGFSFPVARITVNLAPADLPKDSGRFDLAIALGVLLASGQLATKQAETEPPCLENYFFAGELSLTGAVVAVTGSLALACGVRQQLPHKTLVLPTESARLAAYVPDLSVLAVQSLYEATQILCGYEEAELMPRGLPPLVASMPFCMSEVVGQLQARLALEIAAAGGHSLLFCGPPGVGKSMLAQRLPSLLPELPLQQQLEVAFLHQMGNHTDQNFALTATPPYRAPHHSCTVPAMVGGGRYIRPGEISLAHYGVLFMDEFPEFERRVLESLREPLESGEIFIARANQRSRFPAQFQLVAAMNPCPCGYLGHAQRTCRCTADQVTKYRNKLSGPLLDRIDLHVWLPFEVTDFSAQPRAEGSGSIRDRVEQARHRQQHRQGCLNAQLRGEQLTQHMQLSAVAQQLLLRAVQKWGWSLRVVQRLQRIGRTIADLAQSPEVTEEHVALAMQFREQNEPKA